MPVQVQTNDASALTDSDLDELASMGGSFGIGELSKAKEDWVLVTTARIDGKLNGFSFSTLERIGGTPCVLLGLLSVKRSTKRDQVLAIIRAEQPVTRGGIVAKLGDDKGLSNMLAALKKANKITADDGKYAVA